jgi:hypothetical protein
LTVEHRAAPSPKPPTIEPANRGMALALEMSERRHHQSKHPVSAAGVAVFRRPG